jgi:cytochrome b561
MSITTSGIDMIPSQKRISHRVKHPASIRIFHWIMALLIIGMIASGVIMVRMDDANPLKYESLYFWHQSFGLLVFGIGSIRLLNRLRVRLAPLPASIPQALRVVAKLTYSAFYALMMVLPLSGLLMSSAFPEGNGIPFFMLTIASFTGPDVSTFELAKLMHRTLAYAFASLIALHLLATLKHHFFDAKDNDVLKRML